MDKVKQRTTFKKLLFLLGNDDLGEADGALDPAGGGVHDVHAELLEGLVDQAAAIAAIIRAKQSRLADLNLHGMCVR